MPFSAGMFIYALMFMLGIIIVQQLPVLPDAIAVSLLAGILFVFFIIFKLFSEYRVDNRLGLVLIKLFALSKLYILLILCGFIYAYIFAHNNLSNRLDESLTGKDILVSGLVSGIPDTRGTVQRFELSIFSFDSVTKKSGSGYAEKSNETLLQRANHPVKIRLSWYYGPKINAGEVWQLLLRLKPPHGFMNPGAFDYESWLFQRGIHATGYVKKSPLNQRLQTASGWSVDRLRQQISQQLQRLSDEHQPASSRHAYALVKALAVGDKSSISAPQWELLTATGTSHLMAISGLHIGLASLFAYVLIRRVLFASWMKRIPAQHIALSAGFILATLYALLAGLSIPTQRAIIMLFAISLMMLLRRNTRPLDTLGFALFLVLLIDPSAVMSAGFWFSFSAVAVIFISLFSAQGSATVTADKKHSVRNKLFVTVKRWIRLQLIISLFLLPLSLFMFQQGSLVSPLANLLLIPYVSFLVVPIVLLAIIFSFIYLPVSHFLFSLAATLLDSIWPFLVFLAEQPFALWQQGNVSLLHLLLATLSISIMFFNRNISHFIQQRYSSGCQSDGFAGNQGLTAGASHTALTLRMIIIVAALPMLLPIVKPVFAKKNLLPRDGEFQLTILDIGQGSSAVIKTRNHLLIFDAGARFSDKLNAGTAVVIPYLRFLGVDRPDRLIISHGDADHIGGAQALLDTYPDLELYGQDLETLTIKTPVPQKNECVEGLQWHWDGVDFLFLSPPVDNERLSVKHRNNHSCVLRISSAAGSVLLTGDIEARVEVRLVKKYGDLLASDVLVVPHHGSNTSSSKRFIATVNAKISVISAAYKNRYRLPSTKVLARYEKMKMPVIQTADSGAITIRFMADNHEDLIISRYRQQKSRYWHHQPDLTAPRAFRENAGVMKSALLKQIE